MTGRELRAGVLVVALCAALFALAFRALEGAELAWRIAGHDVSLAEPRALAALAVLPFLVWASFVTLTEHGPVQRGLSLLVRAVLAGLGVWFLYEGVGATSLPSSVSPFFLASRKVSLSLTVASTRPCFSSSTA